MNTNRRDFVKGCTAASACALVLPGIAVAAPGPQANHAAASGATIEKSIKAGFGGGFSLQGHSRANGRTYASIRHLDTQYTVASTDLLDWQIVTSL